MRITWYRNILCLLLAIGFICFNNALAEETVTLSGNILHVKTHKPVKGVQLGVGHLEKKDKYRYNIIEPTKSTLTKSARGGRFKITGIEPGERLLLICDDTYAAVDVPCVLHLKEGEHRNNITILVAEGASVSGTIFDPEYRHGIEGVVVEAYERDPESSMYRYYQGITKADGTFRITGIASGNYDLRSSPVDGFKQTSIVFYGEDTIDPGGNVIGHGMFIGWDTHYEPFEFTVEQGSRVHGRVVDQEGKPVAWAEVTVFGGQYDAWERAVQADAEGRFTLPTWEKRVMPQLLARKGNLISQWLKSDKLVDDYGEIELVLRPAGLIKGKIVSPQGDPIGWPYVCDISLDLEGSYVSPSDRDETDFEGTFDFDHVLPGTYDIWGFCGFLSDATRWEKDVVIGEGEIKEIALVLEVPDHQEGLPVGGRIVDLDGNPVEGAEIKIHGDIPCGTLSNADGTFLLETPYTEENADGIHSLKTFPEISIFVTPPDHARFLHPANLGDTNLRIQSPKEATLNGRVVCDDTGEPVERFEVSIKSETPQSKHLYGRIGSYNHKGGRFTQHNLVPGEYTLTVTKRGFAKNKQPVVISSEKKNYNLQLRLKREQGFYGTVRNKDGYPLRSAWVRVITDGIKGSSEPTNALGEFYVECSEIKPLLIEVRHEAHPPHRQEVVPEKDTFPEVDVVIAEGGAAFGTVTLDGQPLEGVQVLAGRPDRQHYSGISTDSEGRYRYENLGIGPNVITFEHKIASGMTYGRTIRREFTLKAGKDTEMNADFAPNNATLDLTLLQDGKSFTDQGITLSMLLPNGEEVFQSLRTDTAGRVRHTALPTGEVYIRTSNKHIKKCITAHLQNNKVTKIIVDVTQGAAISGRIERNGIHSTLAVSLLAGKVSYSDLDDHWMSIRMWRSHGGQRIEEDTFQFQNIGPGWVTLICFAINNDLVSRGRNDHGTVYYLESFEVGSDDIDDIALTLSKIIE